MDWRRGTGFIRETRWMASSRSGARCTSVRVISEARRTRSDPEAREPGQGIDVVNDNHSQRDNSRRSAATRRPTEVLPALIGPAHR